MAEKSNMYAEAKTWSPFKGCQFDCVYCGPSFQRQAKRQKHLCEDCYAYRPHWHEDRLAKVPSASIVFVCGNADLAFCPPELIQRIIERIKEHSKLAPHKTYFFQSKQPECFEPFLAEFPENVILLTTLETNRDKGYENYSKAPPPTQRYRQFLRLKYPRKVVTIEPVMDFDLEKFSDWIIKLRPEYAWVGMNSRPESVELPEPSMEKLAEFMDRLVRAGIEVRGKQLRGLEVPSP